MGCKQSKPVQTRTATLKSASTKPDATATKRALGTSNEVFKIPHGCEVGTVKSVLGGDRIQLDDGRAVTLLGVSAPSVSANAPCATESRDLLKTLCPDGAKVFLEPDAAVPSTGATIPRYLYVKDGSTVAPDEAKFANYEALRSGFAQYNNHDGAKLAREPTLLKGVREGRLSKLGVWKNFDATGVVHTVKNGTVYHREQCQQIATEMHLIEYTTGDAVDEGLKPCLICKA